MKNLLSKLLTLILVVSMLLPSFALPVSAATTYIATGTLNTKVRLSDYETDSIDGQTHTPRKYYFYDTKGTGAMNNRQAYCININVGFVGKDLTAYKGYVPSKSTYFNSLSATKRKGIVLVAAFGYPSNTYKSLGAANANQAIAATQVLMWEFLTGVRTKFTGNPTDTWAKAGLSGKALTAYNRILSFINEYLSAGGEYADLLSNAKVLIWDNGDNAQQMITYIGQPLERDERGAIEVIKKDTNGKNLAGAVFTAVNTQTNEVITIGPTDSKGYAITEGGTDDPRVEYGTYKVKETVTPNGYVTIGQTSWTVTVDEAHPVVTVSATNRRKASIQVIKTTDAAASYVANRKFGVYDKSTGGKILTLTTNSNGLTEKTELPGDGDYYIKEENSVGCSSAWYDDTYNKWITAGQFEFSVPADCDSNGLVTVKAKNSPLPGTVTVKKTSEDYVVGGFKMNITDSTTGQVVATGRTDLNGNLVTDQKIELVEFKKDFGISLAVVNKQLSDGTIRQVLAQNVMILQPTTTIGEVKQALEDYGFSGYTLLYTNKHVENQLPDSAPIRAFDVDWTESLDQGYAVKPNANGNTSVYLNAVFFVVFGGSYDWDYIETDEGAEQVSSAYIAEYDVSWARQTLKQHPAPNYATATTFIHSTTAEENNTFDYAQFLVMDVNKNGMIDQEDVEILETCNKDKTVLPASPIPLPAGSYILSEELDPDQTRYIVPEDQAFTVEPNKNTELFMHNRVKKTGIYIIKTADDNNIRGKHFRITGTLENGNTFSTTVITDKDGVVWVTEDKSGNPVTVGTYTIEEYNLASNQYIQPPAQTVTITAADVSSADPIIVEFHNALKPVPVIITKKSEDGLVENVVFNISGLDKSGKHINVNVKTDSTGKATINVLPGEYSVVELMDSTGKYVDNQPVLIAPYYSYTTPTKNTAEFTNVLKKFTLTLTKKDGLTGEVLGDSTLSGAVYGLYKDGVLVEEATTDESGQITFKTYACGTGYTVKEISPSKGYYLDNTIYDVNVDPINFSEEQNQVSLEVTEQPIMGIFYIVKEKGNSQIRVAEEGAEFQVYLKSAGSFENAKEGERDVIVTDGADPTDPMGYDGGVAVSKDLPHGVYVVHQTKGDNRFKFAEDFEIEINAEKTAEAYNVLNETIPHPVVLTKTDLNGNVLSGAELVIYDNGTEVFRAVTDNKGQVTVDLLPGTYTWKEVKAPNGYVLNTAEKTFTMDIYGDITGETTITNDEARYVVLKTDTQGNPLPGATFQMVDDKTGNVFDTKISGNDGLAVFSKIPVGAYTVKETKVPAGYKLSTQTLRVAITADWVNVEAGKYNDVIQNASTTYTIYKREAGTGKGLPGAEITIYKSNGEVYQKGVTNEKGEWTITGIVPGEYTFKETKVPAGYQLNTKEFKFTVSEIGDIAGENLIEDIPTKVVLSKTDNATAKALPGAEITVYNANGEAVYVGTTDTAGQFVITGIVPGAYTFKETKAPAGYQLNTKVFSFSVSEIGEVTGDNTIPNDPTKVVISKTDLTGAKPVPGAEITIYNQSGEMVFQDITKEDGTIEKTYLVPGTYTFKETKAVSGYALNTETFTFTIDENGTVSGDTAIHDDVTRYIVKKTDGAGEPLAGATFQLIEDKSGNVVDTQVSGENGHATFESIPFGTYTVKETAVPAGYKLSTQTLHFTVTDQWVNKPTGLFNDVFVNDLTTITLNKQEVEIGTPLPGAEITVYNANGEAVYVGTTNAAGQFVITGIIPGAYTFKETKAPAGYQLNTKVFSFNVSETGDITGDNLIEDDPTKVVLFKVDGNTQEVLANAQIIVYNSAGNEVLNEVTNENGTVSVSYLVPGTYTFKEAKAAPGYALNTETFTFTIDENGAVSGDTTIEDDLTQFTVCKVNHEDQPLSGVEFTMYDLDGNIVDTQITDEKGIAVFKGFGEGEFTIRETQTLSGYQLLDRVVSFINNGEWINGAVNTMATVINNPIIGVFEVMYNEPEPTGTGVTTENPLQYDDNHFMSLGEKNTIVSCSISLLFSAVLFIYLCRKKFEQ